MTIPLPDFIAKAEARGISADHARALAADLGIEGADAINQLIDAAAAEARGESKARIESLTRENADLNYSVQGWAERWRITDDERIAALAAARKPGNAGEIRAKLAGLAERIEKEWFGKNQDGRRAFGEDRMITFINYCIDEHLGAPSSAPAPGETAEAKAAKPFTAFDALDDMAKRTLDTWMRLHQMADTGPVHIFKDADGRYHVTCNGKSADDEALSAALWDASVAAAGSLSRPAADAEAVAENVLGNLGVDGQHGIAVTNRGERVALRYYTREQVRDCIIAAISRPAAAKPDAEGLAERIAKELFNGSEWLKHPNTGIDCLRRFIIDAIAGRKP